MRTARLLAASGAASALLLGAVVPASAGDAPAASPGTHLQVADSAAATAPAKGQKSGDVKIQQRWHVKNAKNIQGTPSRRWPCVYVYGRGGSPTYGKACFQPKGDRFWIKDRRSDGMNLRTIAMPSGNDTNVYNCRNYKGKRAGWTRCNFSRLIKEDVMISFVLAAYKGNVRKATSMTVAERS
ncbi:hypothetical protein ACIBKX_37980 [Streptomyces sp. NPDC050658]|uniref:hypothetical protein n=1 Tax=unclassified Streptomyces TaxID=2593676 RepID=UPI003434C666